MVMEILLERKKIPILPFLEIMVHHLEIVIIQIIELLLLKMKKKKNDMLMFNTGR